MKVKLAHGVKIKLGEISASVDDMVKGALREQAQEVLVQRAFWPIVPQPYVRQSSSDRWKRGREIRPRVARYRAFRDEVQLRRVWQPQPGDLVVFCMPIPRSRARDMLDGTPHLQVPDIDNLVKALLDATYEDDAAVWTLVPAKVWSVTPGIYIERRPHMVPLPFRVLPVTLRRP